MRVRVEDVMTRSPISVRAEATIDEVLNTLVTEGSPSVYVTTADDRLAGIVTDYEVLKLQILGGDRTQRAEALMSRDVPTVRPDEDALPLCARFRDGCLARIAVVDADGRLVGNLSRCDVLRMILSLERMDRERACHLSDDRDTQHDARRQVPAPRGVLPARKALATVGLQ